MTSLLFLIPIALLFTALAISLFLWAVKSGQYEDLDRDSREILFDTDPGSIKPAPSSNKSDKRFRRTRSDWESTS